MEEDLQVHAEGQVSGVFPVIFGLYIDGQLVAAVDLRQAGQAWTNVVGMCFIARIDQVVLVIQRGARADDAHLPCQDVVDLGQFVQAGLAQERAAFGDLAVGIF